MKFKCRTCFFSLSRLAKMTKMFQSFLMTFGIGSVDHPGKPRKVRVNIANDNGEDTYTLKLTKHEYAKICENLASTVHILVEQDDNDNNNNYDSAFG